MVLTVVVMLRMIRFSRGECFLVGTMGVEFSGFISFLLLLLLYLSTFGALSLSLSPAKNLGDKKNEMKGHCSFKNYHGFLCLLALFDHAMLRNLVVNSMGSYVEED